MSKSNNNLDVLIVGAGPSGLMMACQLALRQVPFRIIDKKANQTGYSGALIIHSRSLEIFHQMGIAEKAINDGIVPEAINILFNWKKPLRISIKDIGRGLSEFPNMLMLEQSITENLLGGFINKYGFYVERNMELINMSQHEDYVVAILKHQNGLIEEVKSQFLIGADGSHSSVRKFSGIPFTGSTHEISLFVSDCKAETNMPHDEITFSFTNGHSSGFFPLKGNRWRIDGMLDKGMDSKDFLSSGDLEKKISAGKRINVKLNEIQWLSVFHSHQAFASSIQQSRCFLIGDAAHIHSPVGAQGMNTGLQDAYNLAWKLTFVLQGKANISLTDTYQSERMPVSISTIHATEKIFQLVAGQGYLARIFRIYFLPVLLNLFSLLFTKSKIVRHYIFLAISGTGIHYRKTAFNQHTSFGKFPRHVPKPGDRFPYLIYNDGTKDINIHEEINGKEFVLFIFSTLELPRELIELLEHYKSMLSIKYVKYSSKTNNLFDKLGIQTNGYYLIRPDMYIAYRSNITNSRHLEHFLNQLFSE